MSESPSTESDISVLSHIGSSIDWYSFAIASACGFDQGRS